MAGVFGWGRGRHAGPCLPACCCCFGDCGWLSRRSCASCLRRGAEARAIKENDGIVDEGLSLLVEVILGPNKDGKAQDGRQLAAAAGDDSYRRARSFGWGAGGHAP